MHRTGKKGSAPVLRGLYSKQPISSVIAIRIKAVTALISPFFLLFDTAQNDQKLFLSVFFNYAIDED